MLQVDGGSTAVYTYNALDQRVRSTTAGSDYEYVYDAFGREMSKWNAAQNVGVHGRIWWDNTEIAWRGYGGQTMFRHSDWQGTDRMHTGYQGSNIGALHSGAFGENSSMSGVGAGGDDENSRFTGQDHDPETETDHFQYRQYHPTEGRWMSPDPYAGSYDPLNPQSLNRYSYVLNNPYSLTDADGLDCTINGILYFDYELGGNDPQGTCTGRGGKGAVSGPPALAFDPASVCGYPGGATPGPVRTPGGVFLIEEADGRHLRHQLF